MCYCPTPTLHLNLALTGDGAFLLSPQKMHTVWFISILNYGDTENVLINHLLLVIPMSYPCYYTNLCPHKPHKHAHTHTHTHTHTVYLSSSFPPPMVQKEPSRSSIIMLWLSSLCVLDVGGILLITYQHWCCYKRESGPLCLFSINSHCFHPEMSRTQTEVCAQV